jgi:2-phospho-L-lactate guanylyltransferase
MPTPPLTPTIWALVVPVKRFDVAKSRLRRLAGDLREQLALAFACDTVAAALACPSVGGLVVVTSEPSARDALGALGADVVPDVPDAGLNPALRHGVSRAAEGFPGCGVGALSSDLPALRPAELELALQAAAGHPSAFVCDATGIGTTMLVARSVTDFAPSFGRRSRSAHRAAGVHELDLEGIATLRRDVDTAVDLHDARRLGLGPRSAEVVAEILGRTPG